MTSDQVSPEAFSAFQDWISRHRLALTGQGEWDDARAARERYARQHDVGPVALADDERLVEAAVGRVQEAPVVEEDRAPLADRRGPQEVTAAGDPDRSFIHPDGAITHHPWETPWLFSDLMDKYRRGEHRG